MAEVAVTEKKKAVTGVGCIYYALLKTDGSYDTVKKLASLIEITNKNNMETSKANAGDSVYMQTTEYSGSDLTFSVYNIPREAEAELYGHKISSNGGIISNSSDVVPYVALMAELHSNTESGRVTDYLTLYKGQLQEPELTGKTKEEGKTEYQVKSISGSFQQNDNGLYRYLVSSDDEGFNATEWATKWGKEVIIPTEKTETVA